ncbi:hypothetical protein [Desulfobacterium sp. N47]|uniref:DUF5666 domain-containing protein n=1 Tax=uncultured Desulfobacterium sp. TaxID=201089 RepID=E1YF15_9BACT|nr:hypothetical protein N47_J01400 [uncultured Desulfobacterium sp.]
MIKRLLMLFVAISFVLCASIFAVEANKTVSATKAELIAPPPTAKPAVLPANAIEKETRMSATGKVTEISDTMLKIDRHVKGNSETMEFILEKACPNITAGDKVKISYITKDEKNIVVKITKITKTAKHHAKKKTAAMEEVKAG